MLLLQLFLFFGAFSLAWLILLSYLNNGCPLNRNVQGSNSKAYLYIFVVIFVVIGISMSNSSLVPNRGGGYGS